MRILVSIPTFNNSRFGYTIRRTLEALVGQSFRDFRVLIVYRPSPGDMLMSLGIGSTLRLGSRARDFLRRL